MSFRELAANVATQAHGIAGTTVTLTGPDGIPREYDDCIFESGRTTESPDSGAEVVVGKPNASFPRSSLVVVPEDGENWMLEAPLDPLVPDTLTAFSMDKSKSSEGGRSLNTIILYLSEVKQS